MRCATVMRQRRPRTLARAVLGSLLLACGCKTGDHVLPPASFDVPASRLELFAPDSSGHLPVAAAIASTGDVWSLTTHAPFLTVYSPHGKAVKSFGDSGSGPGELRFPLGFVLTTRGALIWDNARRTIVALDATGSSLGDRSPEFSTSGVWPQLPFISYGRPGQLRSLGGGFALATYRRPVRQSVDETYLAVVQLDSSGGVTDTLFNALTDTAGMAAQLGAARELVPIPLWTTCADSQIISYRPLTGVVTRSDVHGATLRSDTVPTTSGPLTDEAILRNLAFQLDGLLSHGEQPTQAERRAMLKSLLEQSKSTGRYPEHAPAFVDLLCDPAGRAWLERFSLTDSPIGYGRSWLILDAQGHQMDVTLPAQFRLLDFGSSGGIGYVTDSVGVIRMARLPQLE